MERSSRWRGRRTLESSINKGAKRKQITQAREARARRSSATSGEFYFLPFYPSFLLYLSSSWSSLHPAYFDINFYCSSDSCLWHWIDSTYVSQFFFYVMINLLCLHLFFLYCNNCPWASSFSFSLCNLMYLTLVAYYLSDQNNLIMGSHQCYMINQVQHSVTVALSVVVPWNKLLAFAPNILGLESPTRSLGITSSFVYSKTGF